MYDTRFSPLSFGAVGGGDVQRGVGGGCCHGFNLTETRRRSIGIRIFFSSKKLLTTLYIFYYDRGRGRDYVILAFLLKAQVDPSLAFIVYARDGFVKCFFTIHKMQ